MHTRLIQEGFNRRYVLLPLLLSILLVVLGFGIGEARRAQTSQLDDELRTRQEVIRLLGEAEYKVLAAESAQRGFLLTGEEQYLAPMDAGISDAQTRLDELIAIYRDLDPAEVNVLDGIKAELAVKVPDMLQSIALRRSGATGQALQLVNSDVGLRKMEAISEAVNGLRARERERVDQGIASWNVAMRWSTIIGFGSMVFTIAVLVVLGLLATRDIRRRENFATMLATQIDSRTSELRDLSRHMSRVAEAEKHALARELHDELGGLLVVMRMDLSQIKKRLGSAADDPDLKPHWDRVQQALAAGLELKRRVIEELRPTLLDNMGLFTALRWLATQRAEQARLQLQMSGLDEDIELPSDTAIAVFRSVQEAVSNTVEHAGATRLAVEAEVGAGQLTVRVADNGCGIAPDAEHRSGSHGVKQMRFRMESVGGDLRIAPGQPGTIVEFSVPLTEERKTQA